MHLSKIQLNNEPRIAIGGETNPDVLRKIFPVGQLQWNQTLNCWHLPYSKAVFDKLKEFFPGLTYEDKTQNIQTSSRPLILEVYRKIITLKLPKNETDVRFLKQIRFSRWDQKNFCWTIPNYPGNLEILKEYFKERIQNVTIHETEEINLRGQFYQLNKNELLVIHTITGRLKIIFTYNKKIARQLLQYPFHSWDKRNKWWTIPYSDKYLEEIKGIAMAENLIFRFEKEISAEQRKPRISPYDIPNYRYCPDEYIHKLKELRYSENTIKNYTDHFEAFINYYHQYDINKIYETMVVAYLRYLVMERKVSSSYQNQAINAIKFYYERVLGGQRTFYFLDRPQKEKTLPIVLNMDEIRAILNSIQNRKHKAMMMVIYSAGLRISELINLKIKDIDSERMQIRIEQSKGKRDRYTILAPKHCSC